MASRKRPPLTAAQVLDGAATEKQLQQWLIETASLYGWLAFHPWTAIHSAAGFPDTVLVRPPQLIFAELKREGADPTPAQERWLEALRAVALALLAADQQIVRIGVYVWRPSDRERILEVLRS